MGLGRGESLGRARCSVSDIFSRGEGQEEKGGAGVLGASIVLGGGSFR